MTRGTVLGDNGDGSQCHLAVTLRTVPVVTLRTVPVVTLRTVPVVTPLSPVPVYTL